MPPSEFETIPWSLWIRHYWVELHRFYEPKVFRIAADHTHTPEIPGTETALDDQGIKRLNIRFFEGPDHLVHSLILDLQSGTPRDILIYKTKKDIK